MLADGSAPRSGRAVATGYWRKTAAFAVALVAFAVLPIGAAAEATRLDAIRARGFIICGIPDEPMPGFSVARTGADATGFDVDYCRAVAAAIFGNGRNAKLVPVATARQFFEAPEIDIVFHGLTWSFTRDIASGLSFGPVTFYDGQAFLVRRALGVRSIRQLARATICVEAATPFAANLVAYLHAHGRRFTVKPIAGGTATRDAFFGGACDLLTADASTLFAAAAGRRGQFEILGERISKEPLAPAVRKADEQLLAILRWTIFATIQAEESGLTSANIDDPRFARAAGDFQTMDSARAIGLSPDWAYRVVKAVGNYGEIYARNLAKPGDPRLARGQNQLSSKGGLLYAPPLR